VRRRAVIVGAALALLAAVGAPAATAQHMHDAGADAPATALTIQFAAFAPPQIDVIAGDTVQWMNASVRVHTVTAVDGSFASPRLVSQDMFEHRFDTPGAEPYYCTLHPFMRGEVDVHQILLTAPTEAGAPGRPFVLHGRSSLPAGTAVSIEADSGAGFQAVTTTAVGDDRTFTASITPTTTASYRAVTNDETSPAVSLLVLDRKLAATGATRGRRVTVDAGVAPASPGAPVVLELRMRQHFGWWPVARAKLDKASRARFALRLSRRYPARVVLTLADGATVLATSRTLHVGPR
jgi:plastocyanin